MEFFIAYYGGNEYEFFAFYNRAFGNYYWAYWTMIICNVFSPQVFWVKALRRNPVVIWIVALLVTIGMWFERFVIIVTSLHRDYLPSSWSYYYPTWIEVLTLVGSFGLFFFLFFVFVRLMPAIAFGEVKGVMKMGRTHVVKHNPKPAAETGTEVSNA